MPVDKHSSSDLIESKSAWPHNCIHRKLAYLSEEEKPVTCSCDSRKSVISSSVPMEHSSEKYDRRSPHPDTRRKPCISSKRMQETAEIPSQTKCSRMKQKRPDMPLYVPRARRLQDESEGQCTNRHTSPGRQKGKRSNAQPLEAQSKRLPKSTTVKIDKVDPSHNSNSGCENLTSVIDKTPEKNSLPVVLEKLLPQTKNNSGIEQHVSDGVGDLKSTGAVFSELLGRDCLSSDASSVKEAARSMPCLGEISNNSVVKPNTKSIIQVKYKNSDFSYLETSAGGNDVAFSDSVISNTEVVSLNSGKVNLHNVSEISIESSVPFVSGGMNKDCLSGVQDNTSHPVVSDHTEVLTCPKEGKLLTCVSDNKKDSSDFESGMDTSTTTVTPPTVEIIISEKNTVIESLSDGTDCVQIMTSEKISCFTSPKDECDSKGEDGESAVEEKGHNSPTKYCHSATEDNELPNACVNDTDLPPVPINVETPNESDISSLSVHSWTSAPLETNSDDLKSSKAMEVCDEKVSISSKMFSDNGDSTLEVESWDSMFDDDGECLNPEVVRELIAAVGNVQIKTSKKDYTEYKPLEPIVDEEFSNIIEIYGFPVEFQTQDLISAFSCFKKQDFTIKWVDDCHALGIFSGAFAVFADEDLNKDRKYSKAIQVIIQLTRLHIRSFDSSTSICQSEAIISGIRESKLKAKRYAEHLLPCKPRPATSATLARRLVTGALGLKSNVSREQRETERLAIKQARDRKRQVAKQRQDIWNGIVS